MMSDGEAGESMYTYLHAVFALICEMWLLARDNVEQFSNAPCAPRG